MEKSILTILILISVVIADQPYFLDFGSITNPKLDNDSVLKGFIIKKKNDDEKAKYFGLSTSQVRNLQQISIYEKVFGSADLNLNKQYNTPKPKINDQQLKIDANLNFEAIRPMLQVLGTSLTYFRHYSKQITQNIELLDYFLSLPSNSVEGLKGIQRLKKIYEASANLRCCLLTGVQSISIMGDGNKISSKSRNIFVKGNNLKISATNTLVLLKDNPQADQSTIRGDQVLRTDAYEFHFDKITKDQLLALANTPVNDPSKLNMLFKQYNSVIKVIGN